MKTHFFLAGFAILSVSIALPLQAAQDLRDELRIDATPNASSTIVAMGSPEKEPAAGAAQPVAAAKGLKPPDAPDVVAQVAAWRNGEGRAALLALESLVAAAADGKAREQLADAISAALGRDAAPEAKRFLCNQLAVVGSEKQVPALAALAAHPEIGVAACGALENIGGSGAVAALRGALEKADDKTAVCIVRALGVLKGVEAVDAIVSRLPRFDRDGRAAAWLALGRIGTEEALETLNEAAGSAAADEREALAQARFAAAVRISNRGRSAVVFKTLAAIAGDAALPAGLRDAALILGWRLSDDAGASLDQALGSGDAVRQSAALKAIGQIGAKKFADLLSARAGTLPPRYRARAMNLLGASGSDKAREAVRKGIASDDAWVRREAIRAAGQLDDATAADALVGRLSDADANERRVLVDALTAIRGDEVNERLLAGLQSTPAASRAIADILAARDTKGSPLVARLIEIAGRETGPKAVSALQALGAMGSADAAAELMPLLSDPDAGKSAAALSAVQQIYRRTDEDSGPAVLKAWPAAAPALRAKLAGLLATAAQTPDTVAAVKKELQGGDLEARLAVLRVLADWKNKDLQPDLAAVAGRATDEREKALAMRALAVLAPPADGTNLAKGATADSPDGVEKDGAAGGNFSWTKEATAVALSKGGRDVWRFHYSTNDTKPFFHPVALPGGLPLSCQSPPDHVWHYGLWFSWKYINKANYWEMDKKTGACEGTTAWSDVKVETKPDFSATISMALDYRKAGAAAPAMTEKRTIAISAPAADGSYTMDWTQEFKVGAEDLKLDRTPPAKQPDGSAAGGYAGLSCRFSPDLKDARVTATADIGSLKNSRYGFAATAADFNGAIGGAEAGLAMLNHPGNPRAPTRWYAIADPKQPFWFLNASLLQLEPMDVPAGKTMTLRYRVIVHPGRWDAARLNEAAENYAKGT